MLIGVQPAMTLPGVPQTMLPLPAIEERWAERLLQLRSEQVAGNVGVLAHVTELRARVPLPAAATEVAAQAEVADGAFRLGFAAAIAQRFQTNLQVRVHAFHAAEGQTWPAAPYGLLPNGL